MKIKMEYTENEEVMSPTKSETSKRRIALVGNIANNFFREALVLQRSGIIDVTLFVDKNPDIHPTALPETEDPTYERGYPDWIREFKSLDGRETDLIRRGRTDLLGPSTRDLIDELNTFDIVIVSAVGNLLSPALTTTTVFRPTGGDLTVLPWWSRTIANLLQYHLRWWEILNPSLFRAIVAQSRVFRNALDHMDFFAVKKQGPYLTALKKLGVPEKKIVPGIDLAIDTAIFCPSPNSQNGHHLALASQIGLDQEGKFVVFLAGRYMAKANRVSRSVGDWKASDQAIIGFRNFLEAIPEASRDLVELWIPDSQMSPQISEAKKLVRKLGIEARVRFIRGENPAALTRPEMIAVYSVASVCLDDFGAGWFGSVVVEALSCECPVITWVSPEFMKDYYDWHPILLAQTTHDIGERLGELFHLDAESYTRLRSDSRRWVQTNFTEQNTVSRYTHIVERNYRN